MAQIVLGYPYNREKLFNPDGHPTTRFFEFAAKHYGPAVDPRSLELMWQEGKDGVLRLSLWATPDPSAPVILGSVVASFDPATSDAYFVHNFPSLFNSKWAGTADRLATLAFELGLTDNPGEGVSFLLTNP